MKTIQNMAELKDTLVFMASEAEFGLDCIPGLKRVTQVYIRGHYNDRIQAAVFYGALKREIGALWHQRRKKVA
jgi:hypothetical protein